MDRFRSARFRVGATLIFLFCFSPASPSFGQFDGLMVDGNTIRRFDVPSGVVLDTRTITGQQALFGMLAMDSAQQFLYLIDGFNESTSDRTFRLNWQTGAGIVVGNTGDNWNFRWLDFRPPSGLLYAGTDNELYSINPITGAATFLRNITAAPGTTQLGQITAFAIRSDGQAFVADLDNFGNNDFQLYSLNLSTGQASRIGTMFTATGLGEFWAEDLTFAPDGQLYATRHSGTDNSLYRIDPATGAATFLYNVGSGNFGLGVAFVVPEPTCIAGATFGLLWLITNRRR